MAASMNFRKRVQRKLRWILLGEKTARFLAQDPDLSAHDIGEWTYGHLRVMAWRKGYTLKVGRFCSFAEGVVVMLGVEHRIDWVANYPFITLFPRASGFPGWPRVMGDTVIGHDVWIGACALILPGVTIGNGAVVGAGSVVRTDVAPYSIVAGNPARLVRLRFDKSLIADLERIAWWDWPLPKIEEAWPLLLSDRVEEFIAKYGSTPDPEESEAKA